MKEPPLVVVARKSNGNVRSDDYRWPHDRSFVTAAQFITGLSGRSSYVWIVLAKTW